MQASITINVMIVTSFVHESAGALLALRFAVTLDAGELEEVGETRLGEH